ncbi:receptor activity-modifying protein 3 [Brachionichthys hirsutus]|uniref:receptor activity-modifying protein 3 n=1 Tax=Brachionichthys hirsutus TaxID=412623 RepID=UPI00360536F7
MVGLFGVTFHVVSFDPSYGASGQPTASEVFIMILYLLFPGLILGAVESLSANVTRDELRKAERNQTFKHFQDQAMDFSARRCHQDVLTEFSHSICGAVFRTEILSISKDKWCVLENVIGPYNNMTLCLEMVTNLAGCYYPNTDTQDFFLYIHSLYFQDCSQGELPLVDAPQGLVILLTLIPVAIIPVLVYLVVWKSKVQNYYLKD